MPIPAYMWLKDDGGAHIKGSVDVSVSLTILKGLLSFNN